MRGLIIDTETTGLSHNYNQVLTVGMLLSDITPGRLRFINDNHVKIKHREYNINKIAMAINKIDLNKHHDEADYPEIACKKINQFIKKNKIYDIPLIGHNLSFDIRFLRELFRQANVDYLLDLEVLDTRDLWNQLKNKEIVPFHLKGSLRTVANHFKVNYDKAHDAVEDCKITANVLHKMLPMFI